MAAHGREKIGPPHSGSMNLLSDRLSARSPDYGLYNGTEFTSYATLEWWEDRKVSWHYLAQGKPTQNGLVESFNGPMSEMCLNEYLFRPCALPAV